MSTPSLQTEDLAWAVRDRLESQLTTYLQAVFTRRTRLPIVDLDPPVQVTFGFEPGVLNAGLRSFPMIAVIAGPRSPDTENSDQRLTFATHDLIVQWLLVQPSREEAAVAGWRYGEAIIDCFYDVMGYVGFVPTTEVPQVVEAEPLEIENPANASKPLGFVSGGQMTVPMRGKYSR